MPGKLTQWKKHPRFWRWERHTEDGKVVATIFGEGDGHDKWWAWFLPDGSNSTDEHFGNAAAAADSGLIQLGYELEPLTAQELTALLAVVPK